MMGNLKWECTIDKQKVLDKLRETKTLSALAEQIGVSVGILSVALRKGKCSLKTAEKLERVIPGSIIEKRIVEGDEQDDE